MATMLSSASDQRTEQDSTKSNIRPSRRSRAASADEESATGARFFLPKAESNGSSLDLGQELRSEGEARVEALKLRVTYYTVQEWRPVADFTGTNPELKRERVGRNGTG